MGDISPPQASVSAYTQTVLSSCRRVHDLQANKARVILDGKSLDLSCVVSVARHGSNATITPEPTVHRAMKESVDLLNQKLAQGEIVYGVNTGYGGSADTRTANHVALQKALVQHHNAAVLLPSDRGSCSVPSNHGCSNSHSMPVPMVRAAMLARCNSLLRGHSAVRPCVIEYILAFLSHSMTPVVPLRGSISASGDLTPLAYIAGALEGNPDISVHTSDGRIISAEQALQKLNLPPLDFGPKEGLGLLNGTAFSAGAASLVLFEANQLLLFSQILTAMDTEALRGMVDNYHPFIAATRPHAGQIEAAATIFNLLSGSRLAIRSGPGHVGLAQDRYALRTATQWIGPQIESLTLALTQVEVELNSTTDNPLIDTSGDGHIHHGGNFQAAAITSAMERTLSAVQMIGKMLFAQCSELINPTLSRGLPPNLSIDDPSLSFTFKGVDINMAAYVSELGYLNHPVSNHVQSAEMHNQGLNSLALIAARYAADAVEILALMSATYLYVLCQALDLRVLHEEFVRDIRPKIDAVTGSLFFPSSSPPHPPSLQLKQKEIIREDLLNNWDRTSTLDLSDRAKTTAKSTVGTLLDLLAAPSSNLDTKNKVSVSRDAAQQWRNQVEEILRETYMSQRARFLDTPTTKAYLCGASRIFYTFVREELGVPIHRGLEDHPTYFRDVRGKECIGSQVSKVYVALREGGLGKLLARC